jgi:hypothetical protein
MPFASEAATTWGLGEGGERRLEKGEDREAYQRWKEDFDLKQGSNKIPLDKNFRSDLINIFISLNR